MHVMNEITGITLFSFQLLSFNPNFLFTSLFSKTLKLFTMPRVMIDQVKHPIGTDIAILNRAVF